jgi:hypothetical protein
MEDENSSKTAKAAKTAKKADETVSGQVEKNEEQPLQAEAQAMSGQLEKNEEQPPQAERQAEPLFSLDELAHTHRVPGWQAAALAQFMGWAPGKTVSGAEYKAALEQLDSRRQGGGRR